MAWNKQDRSFKILLGKKVTSDSKAYFEEKGAATLDLQFSNVKTQNIPELPSQAVAAGVAIQHQYWVMRHDTSVRNYQCYEAYDGENAVLLTDWINDQNGVAYSVRLFDFNEVEIPLTHPSDWFFDYPTGILTFNGSTSGLAKPFKITGYRYVGTKGGDINRIGYLGQKPLNDTPYFPSNPEGADGMVPVYRAASDSYELEFVATGGGGGGGGGGTGNISLKTQGFTTNGSATLLVDTPIYLINFVVINGVYQTQNTNYTVNGRTLTFTPAVPSGYSVLVSYFEALEGNLGDAPTWAAITGDPTANTVLTDYILSLASTTDVVVHAADITGQTTLDLVDNQNANEVQCSSTNSVEEITDIVNARPDYPIRFYPQPGMTLRFLSGSANGNIRCEGNIEAEISGSNRDWVEFTRRGNYVYQTNIATYETGDDDANGGSVTSLYTVSGYDENAPMFSDGDGLDWGEFSSVSIQHNSPANTQVKVGIKTNIIPINDGNITPQGIGIHDASTYVGLASPSANGLTYVTMTLPGTGTRITKFTNSFIQEYNGAGQFFGTKVVSMEFMAPNVTATRQIIADKATVVVTIGDSTNGGIQSTDAITKATVQRLKLLRPNFTFKMLAAGGLRIGTTLNTDAKRTTLAQKVATALGSATTKVLQFGMVGVNDFANTNVASTILAGYIGDFFDKLIALVPAVKILNVTMLNSSIEGVHANGETAPQYRATIAGVRTGRTANVTNVDGSLLVSTDELYDGVHPNDAGYNTVANNLNPFYDFGDVTDYATGYLPGATQIHFASASVVEADGMVKATSTAASYGFTAISGYKIAAGQSGEVLMQRRAPRGSVSLDAGNVVLTLHTVNAATPYAQTLVGVYLSPSDLPQYGAEAGEIFAHEYGQNHAGSNFSLLDSTYVKLKRAASGTFTVEASPDGLSNWAVIQTLALTSTADLFIGVDCYGEDGRAYFIQGFGVVPI